MHFYSQTYYFRKTISSPSKKCHYIIRERNLLSTSNLSFWPLRILHILAFQARDEMLKQRQLEHQQGSRVTWKSASVESLHTAAAAGTEFILSEEEREALKNSYTRANSVRVSRSRGCNESFRQV